MIDLYYWPTPNGHKIAIYLEEAALPYRLVPVDIGRGDQLKPEFLAIGPNNRMPVIVDDAPTGGGAPISVFESAAILQYLSEKTGKFLPSDVRGKTRVLEWLAWQIAHVGPTCGQYGHFVRYAKEKIPYAIERFTNEVHRLYGVLERGLTANGDFVAGAYSIADMAIFPWMKGPEGFGVDVAEFPHVRGWLERVGSRPAVVRGLEVGSDLRSKQTPMDDEARKVLFGQRAAKG